MNSNTTQMKVSVIITLTLTIALSVVLSCVRSSNESLQNIITAAERGDTMITRGRGTYTWEQLSVRPGTSIPDYHYKYVIDFAFDGSRINRNAVNSLDSTHFPQEERYAFDGKKACRLTLQREEKDGPLVRSGHISYVPEDRMFPIRYCTDPRFVGMTMLGTPVGAYLRALSKGSFQDRRIENLRVLGREVVDDVQCIKIGYTILRDNAADSISVWIAPDRMYRIVKMAPSPIVQVNYRNFGKNLWFTKEILIDTTSGILRWTFHDDWVINTPLPDSLFTIRFPQGISVSDLTGKE